MELIGAAYSMSVRLPVENRPSIRLLATQYEVS